MICIMSWTEINAFKSNQRWVFWVKISPALQQNTPKWMTNWNRTIVLSRGICYSPLRFTKIFFHFEMKIAPLKTPLSKWELEMPLGLVPEVVMDLPSCLPCLDQKFLISNLIKGNSWSSWSKFWKWTPTEKCGIFGGPCRSQ